MGNMNGVINAFVVVILSITFITAMSGLINPQTEWTSVTDEEHNISDARINGVNINESYEFSVNNDYEATGNTPIKNFAIGNGTTDATETTDYVVNTTDGTYTLVNSTYWQNSDNSSYVDYDYKDSTYIENSFGRTITGLIIGFSALVILAFLVSWIIKLFGGTKI